jgi:hypothetical protein
VTDGLTQNFAEGAFSNAPLAKIGVILRKSLLFFKQFFVFVKAVDFNHGQDD